MKTVLQSLRMLLVLSVLTGLLYPALVTLVGQSLFFQKAHGSLLYQDNKVIGSKLLAQKFESPGYFWPRPSAADFATVASGASNKGPTSEDLRKAVVERRARFGDEAPAELLSTSGSGLDPDLSPAAAHYQASRVARGRNLPQEEVNALVDRLTVEPQLGFLGEPRVNVLELNQALDAVGR